MTRCADAPLKFSFQFERAAVERVGVVGPEALHVEQIRARADFLVRRKREPDCAVRTVDAEKQLRRGEDLGRAGLVVRAQKRGAVGHDEVLADVAAQRFKVRTHPDVLFPVQNELAAVVRLRDAGWMLPPGASGEVSMCAMRPMYGMRLLQLAGMPS